MSTLLPAKAGCETCLRIVLLLIFMRHNNTAINIQTFTYIKVAGVFPHVTRAPTPTAGFLHPNPDLLLLVDLGVGCLVSIMKKRVKSVFFCSDKFISNFNVFK